MSKIIQINFMEVSQQWLTTKKMSVKYSTYVKYENIIDRYLKKYFGKLFMSEINENIIMTFFQQMIEEKYSSSTLTCIRYVLKSILEFGQTKYEMDTINFHMIKFGKPNNGYKILLSEQKLFLDQFCFNHFEPISIAVLFSMYGGLRLGELCGLKWEDVDFQNELLYINRTIERLKCEDKSDQRKTKLMILEPKTHTSKRIVPIPSFVMKFVKQYYKNLSTNHLDYFVYTNSLSIPEPRNVQYHFHKLCRNYNFHINFHSLRHSYATNCVMHEIDIKSLSEILGHSSVSTTLNLYVHSTLEFKKNQIKKLEQPQFIVEF